MANAKRLIDANKLIAVFRNIADHAVRNHTLIAATIYTAIDTVEEQKTVDAVEVVHGRWETNCDPEECEKDFYCSVCEELICDFDTTALYPGENCYYYCPNCGARMDGEK